MISFCNRWHRNSKGPISKAKSGQLLLEATGDRWTYKNSEWFWDDVPRALKNQPFYETVSGTVQMLCIGWESRNQAFSCAPWQARAHGSPARFLHMANSFWHGGGCLGWAAWWWVPHWGFALHFPHDGKGGRQGMGDSYSLHSHRSNALLYKRFKLESSPWAFPALWGIYLWVTDS